MKLLGQAVMSFGLMMAAMTAAPAQAGVEFDLPEGQQVSAEQMARALVEALATADDAQKPLLLHALAKVLELPPETLLADSGKEKPAPVY